MFEDIDDEIEDRQTLKGEGLILLAGDVVVHRLPGGQAFDITMVPGFIELPAKAQLFVDNWYRSNMQITLAMVMSRVSQAELARYREETQLEEVMSTIKKIYTEGLQAIHYTEAITNSKIRGQVLKALDAEGYQDKKSGPSTQHNNFLVVDGGQMRGGFKELMAKLSNSQEIKPSLPG